MTDNTSREDKIAILSDYTGLDREAVTVLPEAKLGALYAKAARGETASAVFRQHWDTFATMLVAGGAAAIFAPPVGVFFAALGGIGLACSYAASKLLDKPEAVTAEIRKSAVVAPKVG